MTSKKLLPVGTLLVFGFFLVVMLATYLLVKPPAPPPELQGVLRTDFRSLAPFELTSHKQELFNEENLRGKWSFVFFGYLSCPDVCPNTLHELNSFHSLLKDETGAEPEDLQILFISVDPARDNIENLGSYVTHFNRKFIGATADTAEIDKLTRQFGAGYVREEESAAGQYLIAHTSAIFLIDPLGRLVATFSQPHYASTLLSQYNRITAYFRGAG